MNDELMTGRNPKADAELAADLGVRIVPEAQDEVPPVVLGNAGYETDASGESLGDTLDTLRERSSACQRSIGFMRGISQYSELLKRHKISLPVDVHCEIMGLICDADTLSSVELK